MLLEYLHQAAYGNNSLGLSMDGNMSIINNLTAQDLYDYNQQYFHNPKEMILSAIGVNHTKLVQYAKEEGFHQISPSSDKKGGVVKGVQNSTSIKYHGDNLKIPYNQHNDDGLVHYALAFEGTNWHDSPKTIVSLSVLQMLLGGGGSFSAGGPGKGMYSRLYQTLLNEHGFIVNTNAINLIYKHSGVFGICATALPQYTQSLIDVVRKVTLELGSKNFTVTEEELSRAKNALASSISMQLESRPLMIDDMSRQLLTFNKIKTVQDVIKEIQEINVEDIKSCATSVKNYTVSGTFRCSQ